MQRKDRAEGSICEGQLLNVRDDGSGDGAENAVRDVSMLIGVRRITAARSRAEEASDNTGGRSDMNDT
ncbi:hypothetical protein GCM10018779_41640 [Streptomyces griseocarneus]|nr:hypothetical protein GCM10018779_41640 [Streptomyces griseocarneus]